MYNTYSKRGGNIPQFKTKSLHSALSPAMLPRAHTALKSKASKWIYTCLQINFHRSSMYFFTANIIEAKKQYHSKYKISEDYWFLYSIFCELTQSQLPTLEVICSSKVFCYENMLIHVLFNKKDTHTLFNSYICSLCVIRFNKTGSKLQTMYEE